LEGREVSDGNPWTVRSEIVDHFLTNAVAVNVIFMKIRGKKKRTNKNLFCFYY
jgi:hypothetical protein